MNMMEKNDNVTKALAVLRYQLDRYQSMKNGWKCQMLNAEIRRLEHSLNMTGSAN